MRRPLLPLLVSAALLAACSSGSEPTAQPTRPAVTPSAGPTATGAPAIEGLVVEPEPLSREHREGPIEYDRVPPVGGPHHPRWLACDVYDEPVPAEAAVHSLEHGAVWFAYAPDLPQDEVERLAALAGRNEEYVLVSPVSGLDSRIVAAAWGASLEASSADDPRLEQFLQAYAGGAQGGEPGAPCRGGGLTLREARGLLGTST
jgi:hypothetical protein